MGAEFIDQAMVRRFIVSSFAPRKPYREIIMSNPDIDARSFLEHGPEFASTASIVRIYISTDDDRLNASSIAHGGFERLGLPGPLLNELAQLKGINVIDITESGYGHEISFPVVAALHSGNSAMLPTAYKLELQPQGYWRLKKTTQSAQP
jgi:esterase/lipase superfamily enzyme